MKLNSGRQVSTQPRKRKHAIDANLSCNQPFFVICFVQQFDFTVKHFAWNTQPVDVHDIHKIKEICLTVYIQISQTKNNCIYIESIVVKIK